MEQYQIDQRIQIDFTNTGVPPRVYAKQYDNNMRVVAVDLYNGGQAYTVPPGYEANIRLDKQDGHHVYNPAIFGTGNTVFAILTQQMLTHPGELMAEIEIVQGENVLKTATFVVACAPSIFPDKDIPSTDEYKTMQEILEQVEKIGQIVEDNKEQVEKIGQIVEDNKEAIDAIPGQIQDMQELVDKAEKAMDGADTAAARAEAAAQAAEEAADQATTMATKAKGWYTDPESLMSAYPTGENGWTAVIGTTDTIWTWDSDTGTWVDTGKKTDLTEYPTWTDLAGKLLVPCNCIYEDGTHAITAQSVKQVTGIQYTIVMIPTNDYTAGDTVTVAGETVTVQYQASDATVQTGAWLAGRPVQAEVYNGTLYLAANQPAQSGGSGNVSIRDGAEIMVPEEWGDGPWQIKVIPNEGGDTPGGDVTGGQNVAGYVGEIVYFADSILRKNHVWANGAAIDPETWPELAEYAATAEWEQDEDGQYHTPDLRGKFLLGASADHAVGTTGGEETHTLTQNEMPAHNHGNASLTGFAEFRGMNLGDHATILSTSGIVSKQITEWSGNHSSLQVINQDPSHVNKLSIDATHTHNSVGEDLAHNNMPPFFTATPQIRARVDVIYAKAVKVDAADVTYDNTASGLQAENVQGAIDKVAEKTNELIDIDDIEITVAEGWTTSNSYVAVKNGWLKLHLNITRSDAGNIAGSFSVNYAINTAVGFGFKVLNGTTFGIDGVLNDGVFSTGTSQATIFVYDVSVPWDPTWTKKEGT